MVPTSQSQCAICLVLTAFMFIISKDVLFSKWNEVRFPPFPIPKNNNNWIKDLKVNNEEKIPSKGYKVSVIQDE